MDNDEKILCNIYGVKGKEYISRAQLQKGIIIFYNKVNQLLLDLFCVDANNKEFYGMDKETHARMVRGKICLMEAQGEKQLDDSTGKS